MTPAVRAAHTDLRLDGIRLALIEHDRDLAEVWCLLFEWLGADVIDGADGIEGADVLICDDAAAASGVLVQAKLARVPVVLAASAVESAIGGKWLVTPSLRVVEKPVAPSTLVKAIRNVMTPR
jgi:hypothetical protein